MSAETIFSWQQISLHRFADFMRLMKLKIHCVDGSYWMEARPCFFRPMVIWQPSHTCRPKLPVKARIGGFQTGVTDLAVANSYFNCFVYDDVQSYTPASLDKNPRRQLKIAQKNFTIRRITDLHEFKTAAYHVYQRFHGRTGYRTGSYRRDPDGFAAWAEGLFNIPEVLILGGYRDSRLGGVALSLLLDSTVYYASVFCDDESLKLSLYDLFWHTLRESAAVDNRVHRLFMGTYLGNPGLDNFKLLRGAKLIRQPALFKVNPIAHRIVQALLPKQYARLTGYMSPQELARYARIDGNLPNA